MSEFISMKSRWGEPQKPRRELLWLKEGKKCHWCGKPTRLTDEDAWDQATVDHILPRYKGGGNEDSNVVSACKRCNNRRSHEDARGLPEGFLLGKYKTEQNEQPKKSKFNNHIALTADEKRAIMAGKPAFPPIKVKVEDLMRQQRDEALREIGKLRTENAVLKSQAINYRQKLDTMTVRKLLFIKLIRWLKSPKSGQ